TGTYGGKYSGLDRSCTARTNLGIATIAAHESYDPGAFLNVRGFYAMKQSPIFSKTYDFVTSLIPLTIKFPRSQRFVMAATLQREAIRFQELLIEAAHRSAKTDLLSSADAE